jgi:hypothetical protein
MTEKTKETNKTYQVQVDFDPEHKEYVLPLPNELLNEMGWDIGDELLWEEDENGTYSIKKVDKEA